MATRPTTLRIALDWTPNTLHSGLYLALTTSIYARHNLDVHLLPPDPTYSTTPAKQLLAGTVDLALCPSESCIAYAETRARGENRLQAVYAVCGSDGSCIAAHPSITRISDVAGEEGQDARRAYGSYNARYEDAIVRAMVETDGGEGKLLRVERDTGKFGLFGEVKEGRLGATWIFDAWEGVEAEMKGVELKKFRVGDYGVPYGYSPVIVRAVTGDGKGAVADEVLERFVKATREGYELAMREPERVVEVLEGLCEPKRSKEFLLKSQASINQFYTADGQAAGYMHGAKWTAWVDWLQQRGLLVGPEQFKVEDLFTNKFFD